MLRPLGQLITFYMGGERTEMQTDMFARETIASLTESIASALSQLPLEERVAELNNVRRAIHQVSPFNGEPVDYIEWVQAEQVHANDYNPNSVAPPEMELLRLSIDADGYTQPIVSMPDDDGKFEVIDGFHRHRVGRECADIKARIHGYLPLVKIRQSRSEKADRMASTIRHNRARGKHRVDAMSDIVIELKRRNWSDEKIAKNLGMDADEVLRLCQITGLAEAFKDQEFSEAWEVDRGDGVAGEVISDVIEGFEPNDKGRIFHTWDKWECYKAGFYDERPKNGITIEEGEEAYRSFLADLFAFESSLLIVTTQWAHSCEHYLTNERMNRIAWLGQAAVAHDLGLPSACRGGYHKLSQDQKAAADALALKYLNKWLVANGRAEVDYEKAGGKTEAELY
jgi:ParB-like chromosome segregation protein Spo0J